MRPFNNFRIKRRLLSPLIAALAMSLSSASVIDNALRLRRKDLRADEPSMDTGAGAGVAQSGLG